MSLRMYHKETRPTSQTNPRGSQNSSMISAGRPTNNSNIKPQYDNDQFQRQPPSRSRAANHQSHSLSLKGKDNHPHQIGNRVDQLRYMISSKDARIHELQSQLDDHLRHNKDIAQRLANESRRTRQIIEQEVLGLREKLEVEDLDPGQLKEVVKKSDEMILTLMKENDQLNELLTQKVTDVDVLQHRMIELEKRIDENDEKDKSQELSAHELIALENKLNTLSMENELLMNEKMRVEEANRNLRDVAAKVARQIKEGQYDENQLNDEGTFNQILAIEKKTGELERVNKQLGDLIRQKDSQIDELTAKLNSMMKNRASQRASKPDSEQLGNQRQQQQIQDSGANRGQLMGQEGGQGPRRGSSQGNSGDFRHEGARAEDAGQLHGHRGSSAQDLPRQRNQNWNQPEDDRRNMPRNEEFPSGRENFKLDDQHRLGGIPVSQGKKAPQNIRGERTKEQMEEEEKRMNDPRNRMFSHQQQPGAQFSYNRQPQGQGFEGEMPYDERDFIDNRGGRVVDQGKFTLGQEQLQPERVQEENFEFIQQPLPKNDHDRVTLGDDFRPIKEEKFKSSGRHEQRQNEGSALDQGKLSRLSPQRDQQQGEMHGNRQNEGPRAQSSGFAPGQQMGGSGNMGNQKLSPERGNTQNQNKANMSPFSDEDEPFDFEDGGHSLNIPQNQLRPGLNSNLLAQKGSLPQRPGQEGRVALQQSDQGGFGPQRERGNEFDEEEKGHRVGVSGDPRHLNQPLQPGSSAFQKNYQGTHPIHGTGQPDRINLERDAPNRNQQNMSGPDGGQLRGKLPTRETFGQPRLPQDQIYVQPEYAQVNPESGGTPVNRLNPLERSNAPNEKDFPQDDFGMITDEDQIETPNKNTTWGPQGGLSQQQQTLPQNLSQQQPQRNIPAGGRPQKPQFDQGRPLVSGDTNYVGQDQFGTPDRHSPSRDQNQMNLQGKKDTLPLQMNTGQKPQVSQEEQRGDEPYIVTESQYIQPGTLPQNYAGSTDQDQFGRMAPGDNKAYPFEENQGEIGREGRVNPNAYDQGKIGSSGQYPRDVERGRMQGNQQRPHGYDEKFISDKGAVAGQDQMNLGYNPQQRGTEQGFIGENPNINQQPLRPDGRLNQPGMGGSYDYPQQNQLQQQYPHQFNPSSGGGRPQKQQFDQGRPRISGDTNYIDQEPFGRNTPSPDRRSPGEGIDQGGFVYGDPNQINQEAGRLTHDLHPNQQQPSRQDGRQNQPGMGESRDYPQRKDPQQQYPHPMTGGPQKQQFHQGRPLISGDTNYIDQEQFGRNTPSPDRRSPGDQNRITTNPQMSMDQGGFIYGDPNKVIQEGGRLTHDLHPNQQQPLRQDGSINQPGMGDESRDYTQQKQSQQQHPQQQYPHPMTGGPQKQQFQQGRPLISGDTNYIDQEPFGRNTPSQDRRSPGDQNRKNVHPEQNLQPNDFQQGGIDKGVPSNTNSNIPRQSNQIGQGLGTSARTSPGGHQESLKRDNQLNQPEMGGPQDYQQGQFPQQFNPSAGGGRPQKQQFDQGRPRVSGDTSYINQEPFGRTTPSPDRRSPGDQNRMIAHPERNIQPSEFQQGSAGIGVPQRGDFGHIDPNQASQEVGKQTNNLYPNQQQQPFQQGDRSNQPDQPGMEARNYPQQQFNPSGGSGRPQKQQFNQGRPLVSGDTNYIDQEPFGRNTPSPDRRSPNDQNRINVQPDPNIQPNNFQQGRGDYGSQHPTKDLGGNRFETPARSYTGDDKSPSKYSDAGLNIDNDKPDIINLPAQQQLNLQHKPDMFQPPQGNLQFNQQGELPQRDHQQYPQQGGLPQERTQKPQFDQGGVGINVNAPGFDQAGLRRTVPRSDSQNQPIDDRNIPNENQQHRIPQHPERSGPQFRQSNLHPNAGFNPSGEQSGPSRDYPYPHGQQPNSNIPFNEDDQQFKGEFNPLIQTGQGYSVLDPNQPYHELGHFDRNDPHADLDMTGAEYVEFEPDTRPDQSENSFLLQSTRLQNPAMMKSSKKPQKTTPGTYPGQPGQGRPANRNSVNSDQSLSPGRLSKQNSVPRSKNGGQKPGATSDKGTPTGGVSSFFPNQSLQPRIQGGLLAEKVDTGTFGHPTEQSPLSPTKGQPTRTVDPNYLKPQKRPEDPKSKLQPERGQQPEGKNVQPGAHGDAHGQSPEEGRDDNLVQSQYQPTSQFGSPENKISPGGEFDRNLGPSNQKPGGPQVPALSFRNIDAPGQIQPGRDPRTQNFPSFGPRDLRTGNTNTPYYGPDGTQFGQIPGSQFRSQHPLQQTPVSDINDAFNRPLATSSYTETLPSGQKDTAQTGTGFTPFGGDSRAPLSRSIEPNRPYGKPVAIYRGPEIENGRTAQSQTIFSPFGEGGILASGYGGQSGDPLKFEGYQKGVLAMSGSQNPFQESAINLELSRNMLKNSMMALSDVQDLAAICDRLREENERLRVLVDHNEETIKNYADVYENFELRSQAQMQEIEAEYQLAVELKELELLELKARLEGKKAISLT